MTIEQSFEKFHATNPEVYKELVAMCWQAKNAGRDRIGIGMLFEVIRWSWIVRSLPDPTEEFKLNNNYRSRYARLIMENESGLESIFELRSLKAA